MADRKEMADRKIQRKQAKKRRLFERGEITKMVLMKREESSNGKN